ncbi:MAG: UDP-N-acetylglucosamine 2-epimerase (non-hydrolyzing) [Planctomycetes bacterium]|nr:UDP-N-acetylglucosamine 2-epimerase (non-hydrolyzing) [Planctomycetota bacterium]
MSLPLVLVVVGTRPEAIKLAPVARELRRADWCATRVVSTAQHRELLDGALAALGFAVDLDLDLMRGDQSPAAFLARALGGLDRVFERDRPACVVAEGDTTTVLAAALAAFQRRIPFAHVEAGLRTGDPRAPFPEETNRRLVTRLAALHLAPTARAADNLRADGVSDSAIAVTGNPVVDALEGVRARVAAMGSRHAVEGRRLVLVTVHRRESFGAPLRGIAGALREIASRPGLDVLVPMHPNPQVRAALRGELGDDRRVQLVEPLEYLEFLAELQASWLVLTDSGGVQEEAPSFGKPLLVLREETERVEGLAMGCAKLVGTVPARIVAEVDTLCADERRRDAMVATTNPYGDGRAAARIAAALRALVRSRA